MISTKKLYKRVNPASSLFIELVRSDDESGKNPFGVSVTFM